jgi:tyrosine-specific transport protein
MMSSSSNQGSILGGALLVAGTAIGGGMLALPVLTSLGGFVPSLAIYFSCWLFMTCTGLLFLEISTWLHTEANIVSMANRTLGIGGKVFAWILYLFLFYCLTLAYIVGAGNMAANAFKGSIPVWAGSIIFTAVFAPFVFWGTKIIGKFNTLLMFALIVLFFLFVWIGYPYVNTSFLSRRNWPMSILALPISFTSFAYQGIIPTLHHYMNYQANKTRLAIFLGSSITLLIYFIWQWLILGIIPTYGPGGLAEALENGQNAVEPLQHFLGGSYIYVIGQYFAFFTILTSFFGVTLGLLDFLADGFQIRKTSINKIILCLLIFIPPLIVACMYPHIFLKSLDYAGGFGCALLLGLLPILMVWSGRYRLGLKSEYALPGGRPILLMLSAFVLFELACEFYFKFF